MKTRYKITIIVIISFILISFVMPNLHKVYGSCEMTQNGEIQFAIGYQWTNGFLYIDNAECTWKLFGAIPIVSILSEKKTSVDTSETILPHSFTSTMPDVCTDDMISHFKEYSNIFADEDIFYMDLIGLKDSINIEDFNQCKEELLENREGSQITQMSCSEIFERNTQGEYKSKQNREIAREKTSECSDKEEFLAATGSCQEIYDRYHSGKPYFHEIDKIMSENQLKKCDELGYAQADLQEILNQCKLRQESDPEPMYYVEFRNGTHLINNNSCEWKDWENK